MNSTFKIIGPFAQILTFRDVLERGLVADEQIGILQNQCLLIKGEKIERLASFAELKAAFPQAEFCEIKTPAVLAPGFVDCHTHICFAGKRSIDFALRLNGKTYTDIAAAGGGILDTVQKTRAASTTELGTELLLRCQKLLHRGVTTVEIKSGYGLNVADEIKMLQVIRQVTEKTALDLVPTCLAAHALPPEFVHHHDYLQHCLNEILPRVKAQNLSKRVDIFVEEFGFDVTKAKPFLQACQKMGFELTVHADQFSRGGAQLACELHAQSADHLEVSDETAIASLARSNTVGVALPLASLGLGLPFAPAKKILQAGGSVAIASDWNPGSAPHSDVLTGAAFLAIQQKLTTAETLAALTLRAAKALGLTDRGRIATGQLADLIAFPTNDYRDILYYQGQMQPHAIWKRGARV